MLKESILKRKWTLFYLDKELQKMGKILKLYQEQDYDNAEIKRRLNEAALKYKLYVGKNVLFIHCAKYKQIYTYGCFEAEFGKENFMHLAGFGRDKLNARDFYDKCFNNTISEEEFCFKGSRKATSTKLSVLSDLLNYQHVKLYKIGDKDTETEKNKFKVGVGNDTGIMGFDLRKKPPSLPVPVTVMKKSITAYVTKPDKVIAVLVKERGKKKYEKVIGTVKNGLKIEVLPDFIKKKMGENLLDNGILQAG